MERGMEGGRRRPLNVSDYGHTQETFRRDWAKRRGERTEETQRFLRNFRDHVSRRSRAVLEVPEELVEKKGDENKFEETAPDLGGKPSALKDDLLNMRWLYLQDCLQDGSIEWAKACSQKKSIFELLRLMTGTFRPDLPYSDKLSENLKRVLTLLKKDVISILEDDDHPGQFSIGLSFAGEDDPENFDEEIFMFLRADDFFGRSIKSLSVSTGVPPKPSDKIVEVLSEITSLKGVRSISWADSALSEAGTRLLLKNFGTSLQRLKLRRTWLSEASLNELTDKKKSGKYLVGLKYLDLAMNGLNTDRIADMFNNRILPNLEFLSLANNSLSKKAKDSLSESQIEAGKRSKKCKEAKDSADGSRFPTLEILNLKRCRLDEKDMVNFARRANMPRLRKLNLDGNEIGDAGIIELLRCGSRFPEIEELVLKRNRIKKEGLKALTESGAMFPNLRYLSVANNPIDDIPFLDGFESLELVDFRGTNVQFNHEILDKSEIDRFKRMKYKILLTRDQVYGDSMPYLERVGLIGGFIELSN